jgi:metal-responsive CopG/Arc/MetJ family transcriptional regulator
MQNTIAIGVSLPRRILSTIDEERRDVSRSRFVLRLLESGLENMKKNSTELEDC